MGYLTEDEIDRIQNEPETELDVEQWLARLRSAEALGELWENKFKYDEFGLLRVASR